MRIKRELIIFSILFIAGISSRSLLAAKDFTHMDEILYAIGSFNYSIKDVTPPSPGYFLYIMSARLLNVFTQDPFSSLVFLSIFYSGLIAGTLYYFGFILKGRTAGVISALMFLTSPVFWYKGITIFGYLNSGFFILLTALLCYLIIIGRRGNILIWMSISFGILIGVRPQELITIFPLYFFTLFHVKLRERIYSVSIFLITCLLWLIPLIVISGGFKSYMEVFRSGSIYLAEDSVFGGSFISNLSNHLIRMSQYFIRSYYLAIIPLAYYVGRFFQLPSLVDNKKVQFFTFWILPCVFYNIFIQFGEIGHGMSWALGIFLLIGESTEVLCADSVAMLQRWMGKVRHGFAYVICALIVVSMMVVNSFAFFYDFDKDDDMLFYDFEKYTQSNYNYVVKKNHFSLPKINFIKDKLNPEKSIIIVSSEFGHGVMYHLPDSVVIQPIVIYRKNKTSFMYFCGYKRAYYKYKTDFIIPEDFERVVIFDDRFIPYLEDNTSNIRYYNVGHYRLAEVGVRAGQKINFDFHSIRIE